MWYRNTSIASSIHLCVYYLYRVLSPFFKAKLLRKSKPLPEKAGLNFSLSDSMHVMRTIHKCILHTRYWCISIPHAGSNAQPLAFLHIRITAAPSLYGQGKKFPTILKINSWNIIPIQPFFIETKKKYWGLVVHLQKSPPNLGWIGCVSQVINPTNLNISFQFQWKMVVC